MPWASLESISAVASSAVCIEVRTDAARLKSIAAPTKPMIGTAASASMGATPPSRFVHKRLSTTSSPCGFRKPRVRFVF